MITDPRLATISAAYDAARRRALDAWATRDDGGADAPLPYHPTLRAYAIGSLFKPSEELEPVIARLEQAAREDDRITVVPRAVLHFTFLALTPHRWETVESMPDPRELLAAAGKHLRDVVFEITDLQLLPTVNALLLAGVPSLRTLEARDRLIDDLLKTDAAGALRERYGQVFPPVFWHTTLARSRSELCPPTLRSIFDEYRDAHFGELALAPPRLQAVNFDWTLRREI